MPKRLATRTSKRRFILNLAKASLVAVLVFSSVYVAHQSLVASRSKTALVSQGVAAASTNTFVGSYYKGTNFNDLKVSGVETPSIAYNWGTGTPYREIGRNSFSAKWNGSFEFAQAGDYTFTATYDDGLRLYIDGTSVIDDWKTGGARTSTKTLSLAAGTHTVQVEYFEYVGNANISLNWSLTPAPSVSPIPTGTPTPSASPAPTTPPPSVPPGSCWPTALPVGATTGQPAPIFCSVVNPGQDTSVPENGANTWLDEFDHGLSFASFANTRYQVFENVGNYFYKTKHWLHNNHWMVDLAPDDQAHAGDSSGVGGAMIRPDRTFRFQNGKLVIETDYAAGIQDYQTGAWGEIVVTTAPAPTQLRSAGLYAYDMFPNHYTLGLRMQPDRHTTAALMDNTSRGELEGGRPWEISFFQVVGTSVFGGAPFNGLENYWRVCNGGDPDMLCRDRFRLELTQTTFTVYVNGQKYFEQTGMPPLPNELVNGDLYIYLASVSWNSPADTLRYHWDHFAINPTTGPSAAPGFGMPDSQVMMMMPH